MLWGMCLMKRHLLMYGGGLYKWSWVSHYRLGFQLTVIWIAKQKPAVRHTHTLCEGMYSVCGRVFGPGLMQTHAVYSRWNWAWLLADVRSHLSSTGMRFWDSCDWTPETLRSLVVVECGCYKTVWSCRSQHMMELSVSAETQSCDTSLTLLSWWHLVWLKFCPWKLSDNHSATVIRCAGWLLLWGQLWSGG